MEVLITYENLDYPKIIMKKKFNIPHISEIGESIDKMRNEIIQYESYQKGLRDGTRE